MKKNHKPEDNSRRDFLRKTTVVGASAIAAAATPIVNAAIDPEAEAIKPEKDGYRVTQHVLDYYKTTTR